MRSRVGVTLIAICLAGQAVAEPQHLPQGKRITAGDPPAELQCYDLGGFKDLLKLDVNYASLLKEQKLLNSKIEAFGYMVDNLYDAVENQKTALKASEQQSDHLYKMWQEENLKRHRAENAPKPSTWIGWSVAGAFAVSTLVLGLIVVVK